MERPELAKLSYDELVNELARQHTGLNSALFSLRTLQLEIRLFERDDLCFDELPAPVLQHVLNAMACEDIAQLLVKIQNALETSRALSDEFFAEINWSDIPDWKEENVRWL